MASKRELQALIVLAGKVDPSLQKAIRGAQNNTKSLSKTTEFLGKTATSAFNTVKNAAMIGAAGLGAAMVLVGKTGLTLASDLTEVQNVVDVTFGEGAKEINSFAQTSLKSFGLSELAAKRYTGTLGAMMKSSGISNDHLLNMSQNLTGLAGDFASFYNLKPDEAFTKIQAGISGETEPLKQLGINMSVANLEAYALSQGIETAYNKMSESDKVILRYNYLLNASKDAQGDFARTQDSYANQQRLFQESFKQLSATIMSKSLPAFTKLFQKGNELIGSFMNSPEKVEKLQNAIENVVDKAIGAIPTAISVTKKFGKTIMSVFKAGKQTFDFIQRNWSIISPLILGIVTAMTAWKAVTLGMTIYKGIMDMVRTGTLAASFAHKTLTISKFKDGAATLYLHSLYAKDAIVKAASTAATWGMTAATNAWTFAANLGALAGKALAISIAFVTSPIGLVIMAVAALIAVFVLLYKNWDTVSAFLSNSWEMIKGGFASGINFIVDKINWLIEKMNKVPGVEIPLIPKMDTGTYAAATSANSGSMQLEQFAKGGFANKPSIFGEAGPEAAIPLKRTPRSLSLLQRTAQILGVGSQSEKQGGPTFIYSPSYGSNVSESQKKKDYDDFIDKCEEWWESKRRESYA